MSTACGSDCQNEATTTLLPTTSSSLVTESNNVTRKPPGGSEERFACYYHTSSVSLFTNGRVYGGIPSLFIFNALLVLLILLIFLCFWRYFEKFQQPGGLEKWLHDSAMVHRYNTMVRSKELSPVPRSDVPTYGKSWLLLSQPDMLKVYGMESLSYLHFQRHIIALLLVISVCTIVIILPINVSQGLEHETSYYNATTFANIESERDLLLVHVLIALLFMPFSMIVMKHYVDNVIAKNLEHYTYNSRALMLSRVPKRMRSSRALSSWLEKKYPGYCLAQKVYLTFDTHELSRLVRRIEYYTWVRDVCTDRTLYHKSGGFKCCRYLECKEPVKAKAEYTRKIEQLERDLAKEKARGRSPLDVAFMVVSKAIPIWHFEKVDLTATKEFKVGLAPPTNGNSMRHTMPMFRFITTFFLFLFQTSFGKT